MKKPYFIAGVVVVALVFVGIVYAFNNHSPQAPPPMDMGNMNMEQHSGTTVATNTVNIKSFVFTPSAISVKVGTTVTWTNQDDVPHTVTIDNGDGPKSKNLSKGDTYSYTFSKAGTYSYHCEIHPSMHGTVEVK